MTTATNIQMATNRASLSNDGTTNAPGKFLTSMMLAVAAMFRGRSSAEFQVRRPNGINDYPL